MTTDLIVDWFLAWLWHGSLLVLLVTGALKLIPRTSAATRYLACRSVARPGQRAERRPANLFLPARGGGA